MCWCAAAGKLFRKRNSLKEIWPDSFVEEANLSQHIFKLRKALGDTLEGERYIVTLPGRGYRFALPVRTITAGDEAPAAQVRSRAQMMSEEPHRAPDLLFRLTGTPDQSGCSAQESPPRLG